MAVIYSDDFNRADSTSIGADWTEAAGDFQITSNKLKNVTAAVQTIHAYLSGAGGSPSSADYSVQAKVAVVTPGSGNNLSALGCGCRYTDTTHNYIARLNFGNAKIQLYVFNGGATLLGEVAVTASYDTEYTVKVSASGTTIKAFYEGVEQVGVTNGALSSTGDASLRCFVDNNLGAGSITQNYVSWDDFQIEDSTVVATSSFIFQTTNRFFGS